MSDNNFIIVPLKYAQCYGLKGNELLVFSLIFGFSQDGESVYQGSIKYIAENLNITKRSVINILNGLTDSGFIEKVEKDINGVKFCTYKAVLENENFEGMEKFSRVVKKFHGGGEKFSPNNIDDNTVTVTPYRAHAYEDGYEEFLEEFFSDRNRLMLEKLYMDGHCSHITIDTLRQYAEEITTEWTISHTPHKDYNEASKHLFNTIRIKIRNNGKDRQGSQSDTKADRMYGAAQVMQRIRNTDDTPEKPF